MPTVPYDQRDGFIWFNGKLVPWGDARLHVLTHGLHYASAVFEGMRAYDGEIFKLERAQPAPAQIGQDPRLRDSLFGRRDRQGGARGAPRQQADRRLCPPDRLARQRADGRLGPAPPTPMSPSPRGTGAPISIRPRAPRACGWTSPNCAGPIRTPRRSRARRPGST